MDTKEKIDMIFRALSMGFNVEKQRTDGTPYFVNEPVVTGDERAALTAELTKLLTTTGEVTA